MNGPMIEVLDNEPGDAREPSLLGSAWRGLGRRGPALLVAALLVGAAIGAVATRAIDGRSVKASPLPTTDSPLVIDAVAVIPPGGNVTSSSSAGGTISDVDVAIINEGGTGISSVVAQWASLDQTEVGGQPSVVPVGQLQPGIPSTVRLRLYRPCSTSASAAVPAMLLTWSKGGAPQRAVIAPFGLDRLWAALPAQCPKAGDGPIDALQITVGGVATITPSGTLMDVRFENDGDAPLQLSQLQVTGGFTKKPDVATFTVAPNTVQEITVKVEIKDCKAAIEGQYAAGLTYHVSSPGHASVSPIFTSDALSRALGGLVYASCARPGS